MVTISQLTKEISMKMITKSLIAAASLALLAGCSTTGTGSGAMGGPGSQSQGINGSGSFNGINLSDNTIGMGPSSLTPEQQAAVNNLNRKIYFGFDKYDLTADGKSIADQNVQFILHNPSIPVLIAGNTDPRGSQEYNFHLGERRANALLNYFLQQGVPASQVCTVSFGELKPAANPADFPGDLEKAYSFDRRDEIIYGQTCSGQGQ
jgi:peptidoglycan-associated lipoprotein